MSFSSGSPEKHSSREHRRAERRTAPELAAYHWTGADPKQDSVKDISSTGVYLQTAERWTPGDLVSLTLQRQGPLEGNFERRVAVQAKAVRQGDDGVGMSFVLPEGMDLCLWDSPLMVATDKPEPEDILREFRVAGALAFAHRICPSAVDDVRTLLREGLSNYRVISATEIALKAEGILALTPDADRMHAPANVVLRILEDGSWAETESTQQLWAGLLATSCAVDGGDDSNMANVQLLSQLSEVHLRVFAAVCTRGTKYIAGDNRVAARPIRMTAAEMAQIAGSRDLIRIHRDLEHLSDLALVSITVRSASFAPIDGTDITPTSLALDLYARCNGFRGTARDFYGLPAISSPNFGSDAEVLVSDTAMHESE
jgi:hypothetical protein